ncbi:MAG: ATP synthase F1 subunit delta [Desulfovibrionaceae bacterium]|nr:ATP synthase F1 subunit delta [Desulfovibrionaceae bacterium]
MKKRLVAKRYAKALFALVKDKDESHLEQYGDALHRIADACTVSSMLSTALESPLVTKQEKLNVLQALVRDASSLPYFMNFCSILVTSDRIQCISEIDESYHELLARYQDKVVAHVMTAVALDEEDRTHMQSSLSRLGTIVEIKYSVNPSLLGGMILTVGDLHVDASLRKELNLLYKSMVKGGYYGN